MKVEKIDYVWVVVSWLIVCFTFYKGYLHIGVLIVYGLMLLLFGYHIWCVKRQLRDSVAVYGKIVGYHTEEKGRLVYPMVRYETEEGRIITSVYTIADREMRYDEGSEEVICYLPYDPVFFYFQGREEELSSDYYRYLIYGAFAAALLFLVTKLAFG